MGCFAPRDTPPHEGGRRPVLGPVSAPAKSKQTGVGFLVGFLFGASVWPALACALEKGSRQADKVFCRLPPRADRPGPEWDNPGQAAPPARTASPCRSAERPLGPCG